MQLMLIVLLGAWPLQTRNLDAAYVRFETTHLGVLTVKGTFDNVIGTFERTGAQEWMIKGNIDVKSINTGNSERDDTLLTEGYFDAERYPIIPFEGTLRLEDDVLRIFVSLEVRGLNVELQSVLEEEAGELISKPIVLKRSVIGLDFGAMDALIGDEVIITIHAGIKSLELE